jgi:hypothetical protein
VKTKKQVLSAAILLVLQYNKEENNHLFPMLQGIAVCTDIICWMLEATAHVNFFVKVL